MVEEILAHYGSDKVKVFLWKAYKKDIPTLKALYDCTIINDCCGIF